MPPIFENLIRRPIAATSQIRRSVNPLYLKDQWLVWKWQRNGKGWTKPPFRADEPDCTRPAITRNRGPHTMPRLRLSWPAKPRYRVRAHRHRDRRRSTWTTAATQRRGRSPPGHRRSLTPRRPPITRLRSPARACASSESQRAAAQHKKFAIAAAGPMPRSRSIVRPTRYITD